MNFKITNSILYGFLSLACMLLFGLQGCKKDEIILYQPNEQIPTLAGFVTNNFDYTLFYAGLRYTGLLDTLNSGASFTLLAPNNKAFNDIGVTRAADFERMDRDSLRQVLAYHIIPMRLLEGDVPLGNNFRYQTLAGEDLYAGKVTWTGNYTSQWGSLSGSRTVTSLFFSGSLAEDRDRVFSNGVLHTLDKVIKLYPNGSVQHWLSDRPEYSILVAGLKHFGLWEELGGEGPFTVFAPRNDEFIAQGITEASIVQMNPAEYIGARLFGAYILYGKQIFIRDLFYYYRSEGQMYYVAPLRNDNGYNHVLSPTRQFGIYSSNVYIDPPVNNIQMGHFSLGVTKLNIPFGYAYFYRTNAYYDIYYTDFDADNYLGTGTDGEEGNYGQFQTRMDYICGNGIVHDIQALLVLPEEALREDH